MTREIQPNYIGGEWFAGAAEPIADINPSDTRDLIGWYAQADVAQTEQAIHSARAAQPVWAAAGPEARQRALDAIGAELMARAEELGRELSREEGKPLAEGKGEVYRAGQFCRYYAAETLRLHGDLTESVRPGVEILTAREPVGVVAVISPWNFPLATAVWKIAPALAFGNTVLWKPANQVPASAHAFAEIVARQGLPPGTFNLVMGPGGTVGDRLSRGPGIDAVSFTGSLAVGRQVAARAAADLIKVQCEMGSKNALVVLDDADLDIAVAAAVAGGYSGTGQKCTASSRLVVTGGIHDAFVERLSDALRKMKVGHALAPDTAMGPVVSEEQLIANLDWVLRAEADGATRVCGGEHLERDTPGFYMSPCLLADTDNRMPINREEVFGPIASVIKVADLDEAIAVANDTDYGLTGGIVTRSLAAATRFRRRIATGCVMVNLPTAGTDYHVAFGGRKASSYGPREQGEYAREFYTVVKTAYVRAE